MGPAQTRVFCRPRAYYGPLIASKNEAVQALRRSQLQYIQRREDLKARSQGSPEDPPPQASPGSNKQQERRRRSREEAQAKVGNTVPRLPNVGRLPLSNSSPLRPSLPSQALEAEALYQACVREANTRQQDLETTKRRIVSHVRKLVLQGDEVLRRVRPFSTVTFGSLSLGTSVCSFPNSALRPQDAIFTAGPIPEPSPTAYQ